MVFNRFIKQLQFLYFDPTYIVEKSFLETLTGKPKHESEQQTVGREQTHHQF